MDINPDQDLEPETSTSNSYYTPLPSQSGPVEEINISPIGHQRRRPISGIAGIIASGIFLMSLIALILKGPKSTPPPVVPSIIPSGADDLRPEGRGVSQGVSEKSNGKLFDDDDSYNWTKAQLSWQRSAYHFQPAMNWMNDPNGPLYHMGWYHLFYQYNPDSAIWGNITWGHAVSTDMIHWLYLPIAMRPDHLFDLNGVWTGSATLLSDGQIIMLYTGDTDNNVQVQNLAYPANLSDPLLLNWDKYADNPVMVPPPGIGLTDFRDPTTAWLGPDGTWRLIIGSKVNKTGIALIYQTTNFTSFDLLDGPLHGVPGTGMWECVDFYPVSVDGSNGLDTSANGPGIKHVMKASMDDDRHDYYAIGTYDPVNDTWTPDNPEEDVGIGLRVDYGSYYASKTFYDQNKERRVLWGWVVETDSEADDIEKGWASLQTVPREVLYDNKTGANLLFWPIDEIENLRINSTDFDNVTVAPGEVVPLDIGMATQLDISVEFVLDQETLNSTVETEVGYNCSGGSITRGALGPFGILVLTDEILSELTPIYFYVARATDGTLNTYFCADETRSSKASSADTPTYGSKVTVLDDETLSMRLLVDHSIVESFAQGGRTVITSRIYPTEAIYGAAKVFLFNNATDVNVTASITIWQMDSAFIHPFPLDQI